MTGDQVKRVTVEEARQQILDYSNDRWDHLRPRLDRFEAAVREDERERVRLETENRERRQMSDQALRIARGIRSSDIRLPDGNQP